jgi:hypothetical protein
MRYMIVTLALLLTTACGSPGDLKGNLTLSGLQGATLCGWTTKQVKDLGLTATPGKCWWLPPPKDMSVMPLGSKPCDADEGTVPRYWADGESVQLFGRTGSTEWNELLWYERDCPWSKP